MSIVGVWQASVCLHCLMTRFKRSAAADDLAFRQRTCENSKGQRTFLCEWMRVLLVTASLSCCSAALCKFMEPMKPLSAAIIEDRRSLNLRGGHMVLSDETAPLSKTKQQQAVEGFKMITENEASVRKAVGVGMGVATAAAYFTVGMPYTTLSGCIFGAVATFRTGAEYQ